MGRRSCSGQSRVEFRKRPDLPQALIDALRDAGQPERDRTARQHPALDVLAGKRSRRARTQLLCPSTLPPGALETASEAARGCEVFLSIGTSSLVYPAATLPYEALESGAALVEVNLSETPLTRHATFTIPGPTGEVLPNLLREVSESPAD
jgi:hypothetical protein